jgi:hypothetical protein
MSVEDFLARLYVDRDLLQRFLADRPGESRKAGLVECELEAMCAADGSGLAMAANSYAHKRHSHAARRLSPAGAIMRWLRRA